MKKLLLLFMMLMTLPVWGNANENEKFSQFMCGLIPQSLNVRECTYNNEDGILILKTYNGKEKKVLCLWFEQNEKNQITIDAQDLAVKSEVDYVLMGYGQCSTNPKYYYYIPSQKVTKNMRLDKKEKYLLPWPIINNRF